MLQAELLGSRLFSLSPSKTSRASGSLSLPKPTASGGRASKASNSVRIAVDSSTGRAAGGAALKASKSRVTIASDRSRVSLGQCDARIRQRSLDSMNASGMDFDEKRLRRRSQLSLGAVVTAPAAGVTGGGGGEGGGGVGGSKGTKPLEGRPPGPNGDCAAEVAAGADRPPYGGLGDRPWPVEGYALPSREKIPECLAKLLRELPDPRELAPLVRSAVTSAMEPSRYALNFKSTTKVRRVGLLPLIHVIKASGMRVGRPKEEGGDKPTATCQLQPREVPSWRRVRVVVQEALAAGLTDLAYSSQMCANACRVLAAVILQRVKKLNFDRYRLAAHVRIAQRLNQGMSLSVSCLWADGVDRFAYAQFENATLSAQAILFLVYRD
ncbi:Tctex1 domain-containing protein 1 [Frankliniella fusca]|uniref:Tctex1 domain-containing protein 1 n=1 Tax=Frankliniella fusca TaxID=407009 RepID=A0AAE1I070_9NEOP|nr:Tctex1 domain-containing protein 1 [Frankliniella fusca]